MTITLSGRESKEEVVTLIRKLMQAVIFPHLRIDERELLIEHFAWMMRQGEDMRINCRLQTIPELQLTRIIVEAGFQAIPPETKQ